MLPLKISLLDGVSAKYNQNNLNAVRFGMQMLNEAKILDIFRLKTSKLELCIKNSQYFAFASKLLWLHLAVTPSIGIENNHRKNCKQCLIVRKCTVCKNQDRL